MFNKRDQHRGESFDIYSTSPSSLTKTSNVGELRDNLLRDRIVPGLLNHATRNKLIAEPKLTFDKYRTNETTSKQFKERIRDEINAVDTS